ncbi:MAG: hypothetical protein ABSG52_02100 [Terriglobales bacterium]
MARYRTFHNGTFCSRVIFLQDPSTLEITGAAQAPWKWPPDAISGNR